MASSPNATDVQALLASADRNLLRLSSILSTPGGIDNTLSTLSYTLTFVHSRLTHRLSKQLQHLAEEIINNASKALLPGESIIATIPPPPPMSRLALLTSSTKSAAGMISDFRIFFRLWGLVGIYTWARSTWTNPPTDQVLKTITWAQVAANTFYQFLENGAYLASKGILTGNSWAGDEGLKKQAKWWLWSSRFWATHVALEFGRLAYLWKVERSERGLVVDGDEKEVKIRSEKLRSARTQWWNDLIVNMAYAPLTLHWSREQGLLNETTIGVLGATAGGLRLKDRWSKTA